MVLVAPLCSIIFSLELKVQGSQLEKEARSDPVASFPPSAQSGIMNGTGLFT